MGMTTVVITLKNPNNPKKQTEDEFLVDSGAHYTVVPAPLVKKLGLKPAFEQRFSLADGRVMKRAIGSAVVRFQDKELPVPVVLGEKGDAALLGITTLEAFGLMIDPFTRRIYHSKLLIA